MRRPHRLASGLLPAIVGGTVVAGLFYLVTKRRRRTSFWGQLDDHKWQIVPISLAVTTMVFSVFVAIYSSFSHELVLAETNVYSYVHQADAADYATTRDALQKTAKEWLTIAERLRSEGGSRGATVFWCGLSLIAVLVACVLLPVRKPSRVWTWPSLLAVVLLCVAIGTYASHSKFPFSKDGGPDWTFLDMRLAPHQAVAELIQEHSWLEEHLDKMERCSATGGVYVQDKDQCWDPQRQHYYDLEGD